MEPAACKCNENNAIFQLVHLNLQVINFGPSCYDAPRKVDKVSYP